MTWLWDLFDVTFTVPNVCVISECFCLKRPRRKWEAFSLDVGIELGKCSEWSRGVSQFPHPIEFRSAISFISNWLIIGFDWIFSKGIVHGQQIRCRMVMSLDVCWHWWSLACWWIGRYLMGRVWTTWYIRVIDDNVTLDNKRLPYSLRSRSNKGSAAHAAVLFRNWNAARAAAAAAAAGERAAEERAAEETAPGGKALALVTAGPTATYSVNLSIPNGQMDQITIIVSFVIDARDDATQ